MTTFPDEKMIEAAFQTVPATLGLCLADVEDTFVTGLDDYRTRTGIGNPIPPRMGLFSKPQCPSCG